MSTLILLGTTTGKVLDAQKGFDLSSPLDRRSVLRFAAISSIGIAADATIGLPSASASAHGSSHRPARPVEEPRSLDGHPAPDFDYSRPNRLPREMTGYWSKAFDIGGISRTAKIYIPAETPNRAYWTVLAAPDGLSPVTFLARSGWRQHADRAGEGLIVLEPGTDGWADSSTEADYVDAAMAFHQSNEYYSIFGEHYLVGYDRGGPALERWAAVNPLRVIAQAYLDSAGLPRKFLDDVGTLEYDGTTPGNYTPVRLPEDLDRIRRDEVVLPTWYVTPRPSAHASIDYWRAANHTSSSAQRDSKLGTVHHQRRDSDRWMTSSSGAISMVAVQSGPMKAVNPSTTGRIVDFFGKYTRYENSFAYANQLMERPDLDRLGVEVRTMTVGGHLREFLVYVPRSARKQWGKKAPVVFVWPGNTQTDRVFFDSAQWWRVADAQGCVVVVICETYAASSISVSHRDSDEFFRKVRDLVTRHYPVDPTRYYSTGQSAGSGVTQTLAIAKPEYFAAVASTSFAAGLDEQGHVTLDGKSYRAGDDPIPNYLVYGAGDLSFISGTLWDDTRNQLDEWAEYHLRVNGRTLADVAEDQPVRSGWKNRFSTWTWTTPGTDIPAVKVSLNEYRSHNNTPEETPMLWNFLEKYRHRVAEDGSVTRWWSPSGFRRANDEVEIPS